MNRVADDDGLAVELLVFDICVQIFACRGKRDGEKEFVKSWFLFCLFSSLA